MNAKFQVEDVVEWLPPARDPVQGVVKKVEWNEKGNEYDYRVFLATGDRKEITTWDRFLRPLETPKPSIKVGDQVRLTGVVRRIEEASGEPPYKDWVAVKIDGSWESPVGIAIANLEVIRQPFKRGEVVYHVNTETNELPCRVLADEKFEKVLLVEEDEGATVQRVSASNYERRP